jgi:hypothetical protein
MQRLTSSPKPEFLAMSEWMQMPEVAYEDGICSLGIGIGIQNSANA